MRQLSTAHVRTIQEIIEDTIRVSILDQSSASWSLRMGGGLELLIMQLLLPVLASVSASALYDLLKGRALRSLGRAEIERIVTSLEGHTISNPTPLSPDVRLQLEALLLEYGIAPEKIDEILVRVANEVTQSSDRKV